MTFIIQYLLPIFYISLIGWLLQRNKTLLSGGLKSRFILLFCIAKCLAGVAYTYIAIKYIPKADIPRFYSDGLDLFKIFIKSPFEFWLQFRETFAIKDLDLMNTRSSFIQSVFEGIRYIHFIFDLFSFGNIYTNTILFNGLAAWIFLRCWVFLKKYLKTQSPCFWIFLMPSAFFYTTTISKEGIALMLIAAMLPLIHKLHRKFTLLGFVGFIFIFGLLFFFKFLIAATFFVTLIIWWLMSTFPHRKKSIFLLTIIICVSGFFLLSYIKPVLNLPKYIVSRQEEFLTLEANSMIPVVILEPTFSSFAKALPTALNNVLFKPLPGEGGKKMYFLFSAEIFCFWGLLLFIWAKNRRRINLTNIPALLWALLFFGIANLIIIGYTIPNIGAITRYRSIFLPFVGLFCWMLFDGNKTTDSLYRIWIKNG